MEDKRTESLFIYVTPEIKKEFELARDNKTLQDEIIRRFIKGESDWLESELKEIDEATIKYRAKLLTIKDNFSKAQDSYVEEIESIYEIANKTFTKIDTISNDLTEKTKRAFNQIKQVSEKISHISTHNLETLLNLVDRYNGMTSKERELIKMMIDSK